MTADRMRASSNAKEVIPWTILVIAFCAVMLDGFDTATLAFAVPSMADNWGLAKSDFTLPLVLTNIGVVIGYLCSGPLGARVGRKRLLVCGLAVFGAFTAATAATIAAQSIPLLSALRFLTGVGLGAVLPVAVSIAADHSAKRRRELVSVIVTLGLASGGTLGGFTGGWMLEHIKVEGVFWVAGLLPLIVAVLVALFVTTPPVAPQAMSEKEQAGVARLFEPELRTNTLLLWGFSFLVFIAAYTLQSWVPSLLTGYGFTKSEAPLGLAFVSLGGMVGGVLLIPLAARIGITRSLLVMPSVAIVCMIVVSRVEMPDMGLLLLLGGAGAGLTASQIGQLTMAVSLYPDGARTTGVGCAAALGRIGSIVGPGAAGILMAAALSSQNIVLLAAIPVLGALICAVVITSRSSSHPVLPGRTVARPTVGGGRG